MPLGVVVLMIKLALLIEATAAQAPQFVQVPTSVNISAGSTAVFSCVAISTGQFWLINNLASNHVNHDHRNVTTEGPNPVPDGPEGSSKYTMRVPAIDINNNIEIRCSIYLGTKVNSSNPCLLRIQGLLESVSNLTVTPFNSSSTVLISWSPPFTLEGVPILGYNVTIAKMISGENETMLAQNTTLLYSIDHPDPGNNFTVTVVPINEVGAGQQVTLVFSLSTLPVAPTEVMIPIQPSTTTSSRAITPLMLISRTSVIPIAMSDILTFLNKSTPSTTIATETPVSPTTLGSREIVAIAVAGAVVVVVIVVAVVLLICQYCRDKDRQPRKKPSKSSANNKSSTGHKNNEIVIPWTTSPTIATVLSQLTQKARIFQQHTKSTI